MASNKLRTSFPLALLLTPLVACSSIDTEAVFDDEAELGQIEQAITIDTAGHEFMAPYEADAEEILQAVATDRDRWAEIMDLAYGEQHDRARAEKFRARIERGDFSWTPPVQLVTEGALGNAVGAYSPAKNLVFLDESIPEGVMRSVIYLEEIGHFLDQRLNRKDSKGDEGELFRRLVLGERPSEKELESVRATADTGTFDWNGETLDVEHFGTGFLPCIPIPLIRTCGGGTPIPVPIPIPDPSSLLAKLVYPTLQSMDDYLAWVVKQPFAWTDTVKGWMGDGLGDVAGRIVNVVIPNNPLVAIQNLNALKNAVFGVIKNVADAPQLFQRGIDNISKGNYTQGLSDILISMSMVTGAYAANPDFILNAGQELLSDLQTKIGFESIGRPLSDAERASLESVFKGGLLYNKILIKEGWAGFYSVHDQPLTLQNTIYMKNERAADVLVHEATHVWQFQKFGTRYKLEALIGRTGDRYEWGLGYDKGKSFDQLNPEQQAELIQDGYRATIQGGRYPKAKWEYRQVQEVLALPYFVKGWHTVSDRSWENKVLQVAGSADQFWVNATQVCRLVGSQYDLLGRPAVAPVPNAGPLTGEVGNPLPDCSDSAIGPTPAQLAAFAWSSSPTGSFDASPDYAFSTKQGAIKISNLSTGRYEVRFGNSASAGGNVQVTAYGGDAARCKVASWGASGADQLVDVRCFDPAGAAVNTTFSVAFQARSGWVENGAGYVWADNPTSPSYAPSSGYQWNSRPGNITIDRYGAGSYSVNFPNQSLSNGTVLVTAYGAGSEYCNVTGWGGSSVGVACFDSQGAPIDTRFSLAVSASRPTSTSSASYVWANEPWSESYTPALDYQHGEVAGLGVVSTPVSIQRQDTGRYTVNFPDMGGPRIKSNVQVTAYSGTSENCKVVGWNNSAANRGATADVACFTAAGAPVDAFFTATYATNNFVIP
ncbi:MAG TPA: hypothetical protein VJU61_28150 [Polyangiaceae bacterium]|nr:hypothetical protein [Polyangiaceae bacterium]